MNPDDINLEDLINDNRSTDNRNNKSMAEIEEEARRFGSANLDDEGRKLISCPCSNCGELCTIFPIPNPDGGGSPVMVCTGPPNREASRLCPFWPGRFERRRREQNSNGVNVEPAGRLD